MAEQVPLAMQPEVLPLDAISGKSIGGINSPTPQEGRKSRIDGECCLRHVYLLDSSRILCNAEYKHPNVGAHNNRRPDCAITNNLGSIRPTPLRLPNAPGVLIPTPLSLHQHLSNCPDMTRVPHLTQRPQNDINQIKPIKLRNAVQKRCEALGNGQDCIADERREWRSV